MVTLVALTVEAVRRAVPGVPVGVTTREGLVRDGVERLAVVSRWPRPDDGGPDFASVNWHEGLSVDLATVLRTRHIGIEAGPLDTRAPRPTSSGGAGRGR